MFLTDRQKELLLLLLTNPAGISIKQLENELGISRRTVYREFNDLKSILQDKAVTIANEHGHYLLAGQESGLAKLKEQVEAVRQQTTLSVGQRENAIAAQLLVSPQPLKIAALALNLKVSEATIQNDLRMVDKSLARYEVHLVRKKGVGVFVQAQELQRRQLFIEILVNELNEYDFFQYLHEQKQKPDAFLQAIDKKLLLKVEGALKQTILPAIKLNTDQKLIELILTFAVTLQRMQQGKSLTAVKSRPHSLKYRGLVYKFLAQYFKKQPLSLKQPEIIYLTNRTMLADYRQLPLSFDDDQELAFSVRVKQFIKLVSEDIEYDFLRNPAFVKHLTQHIYNLARERVTLLPNTRIETLVNLTVRFKKLYAAVRQNWAQVFPHLHLTSSEMQLILLYFAKEYTSQPVGRNLSALVVCENGIGTAAILSARLREELPELKKIKTARVSELNQLDLKQYDLILSTLKLPNFSRDYQLVSPLLLGNEIRQIKTYLRRYKQKFPQRNNSPHPRQVNSAAKLTTLSVSALFCTELVNGVKVQKLEYNSQDLVTAIQECLSHLDPNLIKQPLPIAKKLFKRVQLAPVGLPNSKMALLHTNSDQVKRCSFTIFDLANEIKMEAMDHAEIAVNRILLMLGPSTLSAEEQQAMGMISSMIIMNEQNLQLFARGNQQQIKQAIANQFLNYLQQKWLAK